MNEPFKCVSLGWITSFHTVNLLNQHLALQCKLVMKNGIKLSICSYKRFYTVGSQQVPSQLEAFGYKRDLDKFDM